MVIDTEEDIYTCTSSFLMFIQQFPTIKEY